MSKYAFVFMAVFSLAVPTTAFGQYTQAQAQSAFDYQVNWYVYLVGRLGDNQSSYNDEKSWFDEQAARWNKYKSDNPNLDEGFVEAGDSYVSYHASQASVAVSAISDASSTLDWVQYDITTNVAYTAYYYLKANEWGNLGARCDGVVYNANAYVVNALAAAGAATGNNWSNTEEFSEFLDYYSVP